ncbi:TIGR00341 family protein [Candidatus Nanohalococcus occultus]|uniref:Membrane protein n=1 Tax=Candidatus Nanohalococcus occultus TaxID=2978047 RepID=A0ABY8CEA6_9ARCH|nr:putative membrane protein [Candidatus Nanohaloarchaeota archaeon SVXNc]
MRQLQVTVPEKETERVAEVLEGYSNDVSSKQVEKKDREFKEFSLTTEEDKVDSITEDLKSISSLKSGDLYIRILEQESLIEKGRETKGGSTDLSQQEIYSQAQEFSGFSRAEWGLTVISGLVAALGVTMDNTIVVIGAMMFAPLLSPLVAASISLTVGDVSLMKKSIRTSLLSAGVVLLASTVPGLFFEPSGLLGLFTEFTVLNVFLAFLVGAAASLTSATGRQDQVAGVAVAIALVPPLAAAGLSVANTAFSAALSAAAIAFANMLGILVAGTLTFKTLGLKPETYYKQVKAKKMNSLIPVAGAVLVLIAVLAWLI